MKFDLNELISMIEHTALEVMASPMLEEKKLDGTMMTMAELANKNAMIAQYNNGVQELAAELVQLIGRFYEGGKNDG